MNLLRTSLFALLLAISLTGAAIADEEQGAPESVAAPADLLAPQAVAPSVVVEEVLNVPDLFKEAFDSSPRIKEAKAQWQAGIEAYPQNRALPDPTLDFKWWPDSGNSETTLMQMVPNLRQLDLRGKVSLTRAEIARLNYEKTVRDVLVDVMNSYYQLGYFDRAIAIATANRDLFKQISDLAALEFGQGKLGPSEKATADSRLAQSNYELQLLTEQLFSEQANMRNILGLAPDAVIGTVHLPQVAPAQLDLSDIRDRVGKYRQELAIAGLSVDSASLNVSLARALNQPDFNVGLMYESMAGAMTPTNTGQAEGDMTQTTLSPRTQDIALMFGVTIPIWGGKNKARVEQAQAELDATRAELERQTNQATSDADKLYWQLQNQSRLIALYRDSLIPQAVQAADLAQTWYESGQTSFTDLMESRLVVENFQLAGARAEADYLISMAELQRLTGAPMTDTTSETPQGGK